VSCGECKQCCKVLNIREVNSPVGSWCRYAKGHGCGIYPERPGSCRQFQCLWLMSQDRPGQKYEPQLRPDRGGVVFVIDAMAVPDWLERTNRRILLAHCEVERPDAWRFGLNRVLINNFMLRDGWVVVFIGDRRGLLRPGLPPIWGTEDQIQAALGLKPPSTDQFGFPLPVLDPKEFVV
jgi:hypothetical protein